MAKDKKVKVKKKKIVLSAMRIITELLINEYLNLRKWKETKVKSET